MEYRVESDLWDFPAWSGGKDTLDTLQERGDCEDVQDLIEELFPNAPTDTDINDFLWFERDCIAEHLGYKDWEAYEDGVKESEVDDADEWFCEIDFDTMERISGMKRDEYSDEDGYQDFVDAVEDWWNCLSDLDKVEFYRREQ